MRRIQSLVLVACVAAMLGGCETDSNQPIIGAQGAAVTRVPDYVSLERTAGGRTQYLVTLFSDGHVLFEGLSSVKFKGTFSKTISHANTASIFGALERLELHKRAKRYDTQNAQRGEDSVIDRVASTEAPWETIRLKLHGQSERIDGLFFAPADILDLKKQIETSVGLAEWVGEPHEWKY
jgi:hypothetical protein